jgi:hypothetical protein
MPESYSHIQNNHVAIKIVRLQENGSNIAHVPMCATAYMPLLKEFQKDSNLASSEFSSFINCAQAHLHYFLLSDSFDSTATGVA